MSDSHNAICVLDVLNVPVRVSERHGEVAAIEICGSDAVSAVRLEDFWHFDPVSDSIWRLTSVALADPPSFTKFLVGLKRISGSGRLVCGLRLLTVPIGWQL